jgi:hypothetical protein
MDRANESVYLRNPDHTYVDAIRRMYPEFRADTLCRMDQKASIEGHSTSEIQRLETNDSPNRWIDSRRYPFKTNDGEIHSLFGLRPDATRAADAKHKLNESREVFHLFIEHAPGCVGHA